MLHTRTDFGSYRTGSGITRGACSPAVCVCYRDQARHCGIYHFPALRSCRNACVLGWQGGIGKLAGPTGGYLIGCIPLILIAGAFISISEKRKGALKYVIQALGLAIGVLVCYALGTAWFMIESGSDLMTSLTLCVLPFLPFDAIKIAIAMIVGNPLRVALSKADLMHYGAKA